MIQGMPGKLCHMCDCRPCECAEIKRADAEARRRSRRGEPELPGDSRAGARELLRRSAEKAGRSVRSLPPEKSPQPPGYVYFVQPQSGGRIKVGTSSRKALDRRMSEISVGSPEPLVLLGVVDRKEFPEKSLHRRFAEHRRHGEWFEPAPELIEFITRHGKDPE